VDVTVLGAGAAVVDAGELGHPIVDLLEDHQPVAELDASLGHAGLARAAGVRGRGADRPTNVAPSAKRPPSSCATSITKRVLPHTPRHRSQSCL
jgi:hypothetical protein